jgi:hypothetical protein
MIRDYNTKLLGSNLSPNVLQKVFKSLYQGFVCVKIQVFLILYVGFLVCFASVRNASYYLYASALGEYLKKSLSELIAKFGGQMPDAISFVFVLISEKAPFDFP